MIQAASDAGNADGLVFFIFDLLHVDGEDIAALPLVERKARLATLLSGVTPPLHYSDYHRGQGRPVSSDPADTKFLHCAQAARADYIVTGNKRHFPDAPYGVTQVLSAGELLDQITFEI